MAAGPTDDQHDWVSSTFGFDPRTVAGAAPTRFLTESAVIPPLDEAIA